MHAAARILAAVVFRVAQLLLLLESDVFALLKRVFRTADSAPLVVNVVDFDDGVNGDIVKPSLHGADGGHGVVEVLTIVGRYRLDDTDAGRDSDFLVFHDYFSHFDEIRRACWSIYCINERYVYLVQHASTQQRRSSTSEGDEDGEPCVEHCSKLTKYLFNAAEKLARIDVDVFCRLAKSFPPFRARVAMLHSTPCGGGTVAAKLLQSCDRSRLCLLVKGEPPVLTSLALLHNVFSIERMRALTLSTLRFCMLHQKPGQTILLKARPCCTKLVPTIHAVCPSMQHVFISTRNPVDVITRLVIHTSVNIPVFSYVCWLMKQSTYLCDVVTSWRQLEAETVTKIAPTTEVEFALAQVMGATINYQRNIRFHALQTVFIEDLMSDTAAAVRPLLAICDVSDLAIPECIEWKRSEESALRDVWDTVPLNDVDRERVKTLVEYLQIEFRS